MIGIMSAVPFEVSRTLLDKLENDKTETGLGHEFHRGVLAGQKVVVTTSGMGKVRAAARTQYCIDHYGITRLIFVGVAGALNPKLHIGDIVVSQQVIQHDFNLTGSSKAEERGAHWYYGDPALIQAATTAAQKLGLSDKLHLGRVLTGDQIIQEQTKKEWLREVFGGDCVEMEGASIAMVCWMNQMPFVVLRGISDMANEEMFSQHFQSLPKVIEQSALLVMEMVANL